MDIGSGYNYNAHGTYHLLLFSFGLVSTIVFCNNSINGTLAKRKDSHFGSDSTISRNGI